MSTSRPVGTSNPRIVEDARAYHEKFGAALGLKPFDPTPSTLTIEPANTERIVAAYDSRKHDPDNPEVKAAYEAFKRETLQQFQHAVARGLKVMRWDKEGQPYANSKAMREHVDRDHAIYYFPTANGYEPQDAASHPPMEQAPGMPPGVLYNDLFRAVHEYFAHGMHGHEFGPKGELRAWHEHAKMYSPLARRALTNETLGQTQWFFHGPHKDKPVPSRPFPEQRAALLPEDVEPTQLARPFGWAKDKVMGWLGKSKPGRQAGDGIHHTAGKDPTAAYAEKNAVAQALRLLGAPDHMNKVEPYTAHVARIVKEKPDLPIVKAYVEKAKLSGGTAGPELTEAVKPLVSLANFLQHAAGQDERFQKPQAEAKPKPSVSLGSTAPEPEAAPAPAEADAGPIATPDVPDAPNMHTVVHGLLTTHRGNLNKTKAALKADHGLSHTEAHEAVLKFLAAHTGKKGLAKWKKDVQKNPDAKLAKPKPGADVEPQHVRNVAYDRKPINTALDGTALAYHLRQIGQDHPDLTPLTDRALARESAPGSAGADPYKVLGQKLKQRKDPRAPMFNWDTMHDSLIQDAKVKALIEQHVTKPYKVEGDTSGERAYWDKIHRGFGLGRAGNAEAFWARMQKVAPTLTREQIAQSIARLKDRALDKEYIEAVGAEKPSKRDDWRGVMGAEPRETHAKFSRNGERH